MLTQYQDMAVTHRESGQPNNAPLKLKLVDLAVKFPLRAFIYLLSALAIAVNLLDSPFMGFN